MPFLFLGLPELSLTQLPLFVTDEVAASFELEHFSGTYYWATREQLDKLADYLGHPLETFANKTYIPDLIVWGTKFVEEEDLLRRLY